MAYATVTLTGTYQTPDGTPHKGHVEIIPSERVIKDTTGDVILTGRVKVDLDAQGAFTVALPATDDPTLNPTGFGYTIAAKLHSSHPPAVSFSLPAALGATTVEDLTPVDPSTFAPTTTYAESSEVAALDSRVTTVEGDVAGKANSADLATVATTGNYSDLAGQPSIPTTAADVGALPDTTTPSDIGAVPRHSVTTPNPFKRSAVAAGGRQIKGYDYTNHMAWYINTAELATTTNRAATYTSRNVPTNCSVSDIQKLLVAGGYVYLLSKDTSDNAWKLWRAPDVGTTGSYAWDGPIHTLTANASGIGTVLSADDQYLYVADYGDPIGGPSLWRCPVGSATFTKVLGPIAATRHFHATAPDPYNPGHVYATAGDGQGHILYRSTDYGATWTLIVTDAAWQAVQISFTEDWVYLACDSGVATVLVMDRDDLTPMAASPSFHGEFAVPGGASSRYVSIGFTSGSTTITFASGALTAADGGRFLTNVYYLRSGTYIKPGTVTATSATLTNETLNPAAFGTSAGSNTFVNGDTFYTKAFAGAVDPATGIYYGIANDSSGMGSRSGLFMLPGVGEPLQLAQTYLATMTGEVFIADGYLFSHEIVKPLLAYA